MGRKASLSDVQRAIIVEGHSEREIAVKMACSKTAVHTTIDKSIIFELYGNSSDKKKSCRPRKTSRRDDHMMKLTVSRSPTSSCKKYRLICFKKGFGSFLKQVILYFLQELVGDLETVSFIMWSSLHEVFLG